MVGEDKRQQIGNIFEALTVGLYGGDMQPNGYNDPDFGSPDIIHLDRNLLYESKGSISSDHHKLRVEQVGHYRNILGSDFPMVNDELLENPEVYYFLW